MKSSKYGTHRVIEPKGVLPQAAKKISNDMDIKDNEILIDVQALNIDSASFTQIENEQGGDVEKIKKRILEIVKERGKMQNPVTGSGGMLIGTVEKIGKDLASKIDIKVGDKIATLVSLSLTPLKIEKIKSIKKEIDRVEIEGKAVLFESGIYVKLPEDLSENLALAYKESCSSLSTLEKIKIKTGVCFYKYLSLFKTLGLINSDSYIAKSLQEKIYALIEYDKLHNTNYFYTLKSFIDSEFNINLASEKIYIHRHTLKNRLEKMKQICDIDFDDYYSRLSLTLAVYLYEMFS